MCAAAEKFHHHMRLLEMDTYETTLEIHQFLGQSLRERDREAETSEDDSMSETESQKLRRYQDSEQCESLILTCGLAANIHYGPPDCRGVPDEHGMMEF